MNEKKKNTKQVYAVEQKQDQKSEHANNFQWKNKKNDTKKITNGDGKERDRDRERERCACVEKKSDEENRKHSDVPQA